MAKRVCVKEGCYAPDDFCLELAGPLHEQCQFFVEAEAIDAPAKAAKKIAAARSIPWTGEWLRPEQLAL